MTKARISNLSVSDMCRFPASITAVLRTLADLRLFQRITTTSIYDMFIKPLSVGHRELAPREIAENLGLESC
jgi:hypothetical protein